MISWHDRVSKACQDRRDRQTKDYHVLGEIVNYINDSPSISDGQKLKREGFHVDVWDNKGDLFRIIVKEGNVTVKTREGERNFSEDKLEDAYQHMAEYYAASLEEWKNDKAA